MAACSKYNLRCALCVAIGLIILEPLSAQSMGRPMAFGQIGIMPGLRPAISPAVGASGSPLNTTLLPQAAPALAAFSIYGGFNGGGTPITGGFGIMGFNNTTAGSIAPAATPLNQSGTLGFPTGNPGLGTGNPYGALGGNPYGSGYGGAGYGTGYGGYGGYGYSNPIGDLMRGTAGLITAEGNYTTNVQQADLQKEKSRQTSVETRRKTFDEERYEQANQTTPEDERTRADKQELARSVNQPPMAEIISGQALNTVLADLQRIDRAGRLPKQSEAIDADVLRHMNLTKGAGNVGLLKLDGRLVWPEVFRDDRFRSEREMLTTIAPEAVYQAMVGRVDPGVLAQLTSSAQRLREMLSASVKDLTIGEYIEARRFVECLEDAIKVLGRPDARDYFAPREQMRGGSVGQFVQYLGSRGLEFAAATPGDEPAYQAMHRALVHLDAVAGK
jgi:hypothetical protein